MGLGAAAVAAAGIGAVGSIAGGVMGANASKNAASQSSAAAGRATQLNADIYNQTRNDLQPWITQGRHALDTLDEQMGYVGGRVPLPNRMTQDYLESTPGYQFTRDQGLKSVQNSAAARGLGVSGAALKGAANFATGLADSTYQNQFNNELSMFNAAETDRNSLSNRLLGIAGLGENAAVQSGSVGSTTAGNAGNALIAGGNAQAAGTTGAASALAGGINGVGNSAMNYLMMSKLFGSGGGGGGNADGLAMNAAMNPSGPGMFGPAW